MSDLTLCAKASTAKQPKSERFSGTLPAHSHHRLSVFSGIPTWPHPSSFQGFQGPKVSSEDAPYDHGEQAFHPGLGAGAARAMQAELAGELEERSARSGFLGLQGAESLEGIGEETFAEGELEHLELLEGASIPCWVWAILPESLPRKEERRRPTGLLREVWVSRWRMPWRVRMAKD